MLFRQGKIACANVVSDLYAVGVTECDNMLMLLAISTKLTDKERDVVVPLMIRGFRVSGRMLRSPPDLARIILLHNPIFRTPKHSRYNSPNLLLVVDMLSVIKTRNQLYGIVVNNTAFGHKLTLF